MSNNKDPLGILTEENKATSDPLGILGGNEKKNSTNAQQTSSTESPIPSAGTEPTISGGGNPDKSYSYSFDEIKPPQADLPTATTYGTSTEGRPQVELPKTIEEVKKAGEKPTFKNYLASAGQYAGEYIGKHATQALEGVKELGQGIKHGGVEGALDAIKGGANAAFGVASFTPVGAAFNVATDTVVPESVNKWLFSPATKIAEEAGYKPKEGSLGEKALQTGDIVLSLLAMHKAGKLTGKAIGEGDLSIQPETINEAASDALKSKIENKEPLNVDEAKQVTDIVNSATPQDLKQALNDNSDKLHPEHHFENKVVNVVEKVKEDKDVVKDIAKLEGVDKPTFENVVNTAKEADHITEDQAKDLKKSFEDVQSAKESIPEEHKNNAKVVSLMVDKNELLNAKKSTDKVFHEPIDNQIEAIDNKIKTALGLPKEEKTVTKEEKQVEKSTPKEVPTIETKPSPDDIKREAFVKEHVDEIESSGEMSDKISRKQYENYFRNLYDKKYVNKSSNEPTRTTNRGTETPTEPNDTKGANSTGQGVLAESTNGGDKGASRTKEIPEIDRLDFKDIPDTSFEADGWEFKKEGNKISETELATGKKADIQPSEFEDHYHEHLQREATKEPPPIEPPLNVEQSTPDSTPLHKITHSAIEERRKEAGLQPIEKLPTDIKKDLTEAADEFKESHKDLAQKIANSDKPLSNRKDAYILGLGRVDMLKQAKELQYKINDAYEANDIEKANELKGELKIVENNLDTNETAIKHASSEAGKALQSFQTAFAEDLSLENTLLKARSVAKEGKLTDEQVKKFTEISSRLEEAQKKLSEHEEKISKMESEKAINDLAAQEKINKGIEEGVAKKKFTIKAKAVADEFRKLKTKPPTFTDSNGNPIKVFTSGITWNDIIEVGAKAIEKTGEIADGVKAMVDHVKEQDWYTKLSDKDKESFEGQLKGHFESIQPKEEGKTSGIGSMVKELIRQGVTKEADIVSKLKEDNPEMTERQIRDEISGYGKSVKLNQDPIEIKYREVKRVSGLISKLEDVESGKPPIKKVTGEAERTPQEIDLRNQINEGMQNLQSVKDAKAESERARADAKANITDEDRWKTNLERYKTRLKNELQSLEKKRSENDYVNKKRQITKLDEEGLDLKRKVDKEKANRKREITKIEQQNRSTFDKVTDGIIKFMKFGVLAGLQKPILKLGIAGAAKGYLQTPINTLIAGVYSHTPFIRNILSQSPRWRSKGALNAYTKGMAEAWSKKTLKDIVNQVKGGKRTDEIEHGADKGYLPPTFWQTWNILHKIIKTPLMNQEFKTSMEKNLSFLHDSGKDISSPHIIQLAADRAAADANRAVYLNKNSLTTAYQTGLKALGSKMHDGSNGGKLVQKMLEGENLIVSVPTNFALEELSSTPIGLAQAITTEGFWNNLKEGVNTLPPEVADRISRKLVNATSGSIALALGYAYYRHHFGGNTYIKNKTPDAMKEGEMKVANIDIPPYMQHFMAAQMLQFGAGIARLEDYYKTLDNKGSNPFVPQKHIKENHTVKSSFRAAATTVSKIPMISSATTMGEALKDDHSTDKLITNLIDAIMAMPGSIAKMTDQDSKGNTVKREHKTLQQKIQSNIPMWRKKLRKIGS